MLEEGQQKIYDKAREILDAATNRAKLRDHRSDQTIQRYVDGWYHYEDYTIRSRLEGIQLVIGYAEPGYGCIDSIVAFGNWNDIQGQDPVTGYYDHVIDKTPSELSEAFEAIGVAIEWSDEWDMCSHCYRAVRTSGDSYGWKRFYWMTEDGEITCGDCTSEDFAEEYLEWLEGCPSRAITFYVDLKEYGYQKLADGFERGLHEGQADSPDLIARALVSKGINRFIFKLDSVGQFDARFSVYVHEDEDLEGFDLDEEKTADDISPATLCKQALQNIPPPPPGEGIHYVHVNMHTGTSTSRLVSPQEFIDGIKD
jgi:hypothetical protein